MSKVFARSYLWLVMLFIAMAALCGGMSKCSAAIIATGNVQPDVRTWDSLTVGVVGNTSDGSLVVDAGSVLQSYYAYIAYNSGVSGTGTVTGTGSKWTNNHDLYVGRGGSGTLTVADGGEVTTGTLYVSLDSLLGNGKITATEGAVLDADLRFDAAHGTQASVAFGSGGTLTVSAGGGILGAGYKGNGSLTVAEGMAITSSSGYLGYNSGSFGSATVTGIGSKWTNSGDLYVGRDGTGTMTVARWRRSYRTNAIRFRRESLWKWHDYCARRGLGCRSPFRRRARNADNCCLRLWRHVDRQRGRRKSRRRL